MATATQDSLDSATELLNTLNSLAPHAQMMVMVLVVLAAAYLGIRMYFNWHEQKQLEQGKQSRARALNDSLNKLSKAMDDHTESSVNTLHKIAATSERLEETNNLTQQLLRDMLAKQVGLINKEDCFRLIETYFQKVLMDELISIFTYSLTKNDFQSRPDFVRKRVKTAICDVMKSTRDTLSQYKLSVDPSQYFTTSIGEPDRFDLCDAIWESVEYLYNSHGDLNVRIEEATLIIKNTIDDHLVLKRHEVSDFYERPKHD